MPQDVEIPLIIYTERELMRVQWHKHLATRNLFTLSKFEIKLSWVISFKPKISNAFINLCICCYDGVLNGALVHNCIVSVRKRSGKQRWARRMNRQRKRGNSPWYIKIELFYVSDKIVFE